MNKYHELSAVATYRNEINSYYYYYYYTFTIPTIELCALSHLRHFAVDATNRIQAGFDQLPLVTAFQKVLNELTRRFSGVYVI